MKSSLPKNTFAFDPTKPICLMALSSPVAEAAYKNGLSGLEKLNLKYFSAFDALRTYEAQEHRFPAYSDAERADFLMQNLLNPNVNTILCIRGGAGSLGLLEHLDFGKIANCNKFFIGFSDVSTLLINLYQKTGIACVHGPMQAVSFSKISNENPAISQSAQVLNLLKRALTHF